MTRRMRGRRIYTCLAQWAQNLDRVDQPVFNIDALLPFQHCQPTPVSTLMYCSDINFESTVPPQPTP